MSESAAMGRSSPNLVRVLAWRCIGRPLFHATPHLAYRIRGALLSMFGAQVARGVRVRRTVRIDRPWNLHLGEHSMIGDRAYVAATHPIRLGRATTISQGTMLLTEALGLDDNEIVIGSNCWIAADSVVLPGARVGDGTVVGARAQVAGVLPENVVSAGMPAKTLGPRVR